MPVPDLTRARRESVSQKSDNSQTAADFIQQQMQLEADAREALPYSIEECTKPLGPLRQSVFACLSCNPSSATADESSPAGICYACSVQCHGEHKLVELFNKRNFTCDCGTTRIPATACSLRLQADTNKKGDVRFEEPDPDNRYNQNFYNRFCGCKCDYDPFQQKGTMFQCLGLGTEEVGGCGEDWWHPGCVVGLGPNWFEKEEGTRKPGEESKAVGGTLSTIAEDGRQDEEEDDEQVDISPPPGFPADDDFNGFLCYKCVEAFPWIKRYAGAPGFLMPVFYNPDAVKQPITGSPSVVEVENANKRKESDEGEAQDAKRLKRKDSGSPTHTVLAVPDNTVAERADKVPLCRLSTLPAAPDGRFSLFFKHDFREQLCRCSSCLPLLTPHPQLLEEEETYEPSVSGKGSENGGSTNGSGSLLDRGESALRNMDRVRAIEGVMAYNHLKDKLKPFFQQFAESGQAISADDIKEYFAKLRGDEEAIQQAGDAANDDRESGHRQEQSGY